MPWHAFAVALFLLACKSDKPAVEPPRDTAPPADQAVVEPDAYVTPELPACANPVSGSKLRLRSIGRTTGLGVLATSPPGDPRLFVVEQRGAVRVFQDETLVPAPFIDLSPDAGGPVNAAGSELGLLGLAFHPRYAQNGLYFLYYTTGDPAESTLRDVIVRCSVSATDPDRSEPASCTEILSIADPAGNHNGGMLEFGADGYLYLGTGDGGGTSNIRQPQDPMSLLGKMLRIDVDGRAPGKEYAIPPDNPYVAGGGAPEVFMRGLRNPWRWSFDRATGDMWIADVGAQTTEELTVLPPAAQKGANLGWATYEGSRCFLQPCEPAGKIFPQDERPHSARWTAIIGGQVYRGTCFPDLVGWYLYTDLTVGHLVKARRKPDGTLEIVDLLDVKVQTPTSLHADARGELYLTAGGQVWRIEAGP